MTLGMIDFVASQWYTIFGNGIIIMLLVIGVVSLLILSLNGGGEALVIILAPLIMAAGYTSTKFLELPKWIAVIFMAIMGVFMLFFYWSMAQ